MFIRSFDDKRIELLLSDKNAERFAELTRDIYSGEVFPAIRKNEIHFYYKGGCLYKFVRGQFIRNAAFDKYSAGTDGLSSYEKAKRQVENKFRDSAGNAKERQRLDSLNYHTFRKHRDSKVVVLDIEVNLNGEMCAGKKCDIVLLHTQTRGIMFVEGKVFSDSRVNVKVGRIPEVIGQVNLYTKAVNEQAENIIKQYADCIQILNKLFGVELPAPKKILQPAKLLVYEVPFKSPTENQQYSMDVINHSLGRDNVVWYDADSEPAIDEIWSALCKS